MSRATLDHWTDKLRGLEIRRGEPINSRAALLQDLCVELTALVGRMGADALLARALYLARQTNPAVEPIPSGTAPSCEGVTELLRDADVTGVDDIVLTIGGHMLTLLAGFIGDELTRHLLARLPGETERSDEE